ncbi:MAG: hypothetical protein B7Y39_00720 [Bdellovibrio sp. 28-41-41]|nr:MAG: hypothetical protein B7Y39_00720 [Bdellovibrio sp. 28-41-41]
MSRATLRSQTHKTLAATFLLLVFGSGAVIFGYADIHGSIARKQAEETVTRNLSDQVDALVPSFLLPEQKQGASLILDRIKNDEDLTTISIVDKSIFSESTKNCHPQGEAVICSDNEKITVLTPIKEGEKLFSYLLKEKKASSVAGGELVKTFLLTFSLLFVTFCILFLMLTRMLGQVPSDLKLLVNWLEDDLNGNHKEKPAFRIAEFNNLANSIFDIIERHDRARDQAIVGQLTSGIMHDIKTPLASIVAATSLVREQSKESPKRASRLENLFEVCDARLNVIGEIIESTLDGSREIHVDKRNLEINSTIKKAINLTKDIVHGRRGQLIFEESQYDIKVAHDPTQIIRVLINLIKNGLEASQSSGEAKLIVSVENWPDEFKIKLEDNGPGISGQPDKIFRVFRSTKTHGSGLGLLVSKKIVEAHGGKLEVGRSARFGGAAFEIRLPNYSERPNEVAL